MWKEGMEKLEWREGQDWYPFTVTFEIKYVVEVWRLARR
jgi:hypothetical protein